jgi:hypothetical protein
MMETLQPTYNGIVQVPYFDGLYFKTYKLCLYFSFRAFDNEGTTFKQQNAQCSALDIYTVTPH